MRTSDMNEVFDNYAAIAKKNGLISNAENENKKSTEELDAIELLYGIKPNGKDEKDLIDQAHPESVVLSPAYDLLNGLVENVKERQKIILNIMYKPIQGKLTNHKYAQNELLQELTKIAFSMDNKNEEELMSLADICAENLYKEAIAPLALVGVVMTGMSLLGAYNNFMYLNQGVKNDCDLAIEAINNFSKEVPIINSQLSELKTGIEYIKKLYLKIGDLSQSFKNITHDNVVNKAAEISESSEGKKAFDTMEEYKNAALLLVDRIIKVYVPLIQSTSVDDSKNSSSLITGITDAWHALFGSTKNDLLKILVGSNISAIGEGGLVAGLKKSVDQINTKEQAMKSYVEQNTHTLLEYLQKDKPQIDTTEELMK